MEDAVDAVAEQEANAAAVGRRRRVRINEDFKSPQHAYVVSGAESTEEEEDDKENIYNKPQATECLRPL